MELTQFLSTMAAITSVCVVGADSKNKAKYTVMFVICIIAVTIINLF
jgi:hypothetical protein|nr:MAG TPA: hypothetical protein [Caudoviricetes sp.]